MTTPLFSTYSQRENRVTATFLAVLERLSLSNMGRILGGLLINDQDYSLVKFINQSRGDGSIPDAKIETGHSVWFETKIAPNAVDAGQIKNHLKALRGDEKLIALTPDDARPERLADLSQRHQDKVVWANFSALDQILWKILRDEETPSSKMEAFLLEEFSSFPQHGRTYNHSQGQGHSGLCWAGKDITTKPSEAIYTQTQLESFEPFGVLHRIRNQEYRA